RRRRLHFERRNIDGPYGLPVQRSRDGFLGAVRRERVSVIRLCQCSEHQHRYGYDSTVASHGDVEWRTLASGVNLNHRLPRILGGDGHAIDWIRTTEAMEIRLLTALRPADDAGLFFLVGGYNKRHPSGCKIAVVVSVGLGIWRREGISLGRFKPF